MGFLAMKDATEKGPHEITNHHGPWRVMEGLQIYSEEWEEILSNRYVLLKQLVLVTSVGTAKND